MKEEVKMKENMNAEPTGTMPYAGAMPQMQATPSAVSPAQMQAIPVTPQMPMMCCPYLMNMQCPMLYGQNMMANPMVSPMMTAPMANPMVSPMMTAPTANPMVSPMMTAPTTSNPMVSPTMTAPTTSNPMISGISPAAGMGNMPPYPYQYPMGGMQP